MLPETDSEQAKRRIQEIINSKSSEGKADSSGHFTIDVAKAREMLEAKSSADPDLFLLLWARHAVVSGASEIHFQQTSEGLVLGHDGRHGNPAALKDLICQIVGPRGSELLTLCLWNALKYRFEEAVYRTPDGSVVWDSNLNEQQRPDTGPHQLILTKERSSKGLTNALWDPLGPTQQNLLQQRCRYSPLRIVFLGNEIKAPSPMEVVFHAAVRNYEKPETTGLGPCRWPQARSALYRTFLSRGQYEAQLYMGVTDGDLQLELILDGVGYFERTTWFPPSSLMLLNSDQLRTDLSGEYIVRNKEFEDLFAVLPGDVQALLQKFGEDLAPLPPSAAAHLEPQVARRIREGELGQAMTLCRWIYLKAVDGRVRKDFGRWQRGSFLYRFAILSDLLKDGPGAANLRGKAEKEWQLAEKGWLERLREWMSPGATVKRLWWPLAELPPEDMKHHDLVEICRLCVKSQCSEEGTAGIIDRVAHLREGCLSYSLASALYFQRWHLDIEEQINRAGHIKVAEGRLRLMDLTVRQLLHAKAPRSGWLEARSQFQNLIEAFSGKVGKVVRPVVAEMYEKMLMVDFQLEEMQHAERAFKRWAEYLEAEYTPQERVARVESFLSLVKIIPNRSAAAVLQEKIESWHSRQSHLGSSSVQRSEV
jgi:hypothetical protein